MMKGRESTKRKEKLCCYHGSNALQLYNAIAKIGYQNRSLSGLLDVYKRRFQLICLPWTRKCFLRVLWISISVNDIQNKRNIFRKGPNYIPVIIYSSRPLCVRLFQWSYCLGNQLHYVIYIHFQRKKPNWFCLFSYNIQQINRIVF